MRTPLFAAIGAVWLAGTGASPAAPISAAAIGEAAEQLSLTESVHCRPFRHWHRWGFSRGCGGVYLDEGVRVRERFGFRSRFGVREGFRGDTRTGVTIRGEERSGFRGGATVRGGANVSGETSTRQSSGGGGGASVGGRTQGGTPGTAGRMNSAPTGGGAGGGQPGTGASGNRQ